MPSTEQQDRPVNQADPQGPEHRQDAEVSRSTLDEKPIGEKAAISIPSASAFPRHLRDAFSGLKDKGSK